MISKISLTGTKGKTFTTLAIARALQLLGNDPVLAVTTVGHFVNGVQQSNQKYSYDLWGLNPTVCPGRYLYELREQENNSKATAVLECSLGCSGSAGTGYRTHNVGVFLNVYEDHLGSSSRLKTKEDLLRAKRFIFSQLKIGGWAVGNAEDPLVLRAMESASTSRLKKQLLAFGLSLLRDKLPPFLREAPLVTLRDAKVIYSTPARDELIVDTKAVPWTFQGRYPPSLYALLAATAAIIARHEGEISKGLGDALTQVAFKEEEGRLVVFTTPRGVKVIADYAHEEVSLRAVASLAHTLKGKGGRVIGVVRLSHDRTDERIEKIARTIAPAFDSFIVYDKIDGFWKKPLPTLRSRLFVQEVGLTSRKFFEALERANSGAGLTRIIRQDEAIQHAAADAGAEDVVVVIVGDDVRRSMGFIREYFGISSKNC